MRVAILGNSGSGKSTLARWLATQGDAALLDMDTVAWLPGDATQRRPLAEAAGELRAFCETHPHWVVEGCYAGLIEVALAYQPTLIFLNPGTSACEAHCRARPWEPHKYPTREAQDANLAPLLAWVRDYTQRDGELSLAGHRAVFEAYQGPRLEWVKPVVYEPPQADLLDLLSGAETARS